VRQLGIGFPVLLDPDGTELARRGLQILPSAFLADTKGRWRLMAQGPVSWDDPAVLATIEKLIGESD
jgi:hypothetical protein